MVTSRNIKYVTVRHDSFYRLGQKSEPLCLTFHIFKVPEPICVIFGTLKHCVVLNTSAKCKNKWRHLAIDKVNNLVFHRQKAKPLHSFWHGGLLCSGGQKYMYVCNRERTAEVIRVVRSHPWISTKTHNAQRGHQDRRLRNYLIEHILLPLSYRFRIIVMTFFCGKSSIILPHHLLFLAPSWDNFKFRRDRWHQKTRISWLSCDVVCMIILFIFL